MFLEPKFQQDPSRNEPLAGYEDSVWTRAVVGLALAAIVVWVGFVNPSTSLKWRGTLGAHAKATQTIVNPRTGMGQKAPETVPTFSQGEGD